MPHTQRFAMSSSAVRLAAFVCTLVLCFAATPFRAAEAPPPKKIATVEGITEFQFDNGLRVLLFPEIGRAHV